MVSPGTALHRKWAFSLQRAWNLLLGAGRTGLIPRSDPPATCAHTLVKLAGGPGAAPPHGWPNRKALSFEQIASYTLPSKKMKAFSVAWQPASVWGLLKQFRDQRMAGDKRSFYLICSPGWRRIVGGLFSSFPGTTRIVITVLSLSL